MGYIWPYTSPGSRAGENTHAAAVERNSISRLGRPGPSRRWPLVLGGRRQPGADGPIRRHPRPRRPFFDFQASAGIKAPAVPPELRTLKLSDALVHHWIDGKEVKLSFYREQDKAEFIIWVNIVVEADRVADSDGEYEGTYELTYSSERGDNDLPPLTGKIGCGMD